MSLSSFWEQEKDLTFGVFNHFTSKHFTHIPWFVSTSSALLRKKASSEQMGWARSLLTGAMKGRSPPLTLQRHPWVPLPFQQDPSDQWNTACTPWLLPWAKAVKERAKVLPDFKSMAVQLLHSEGKTHNARSLLLGAYLTALLHPFIEFSPGTEIIWSTLEIL